MGARKLNIDFFKRLTPGFIIGDYEILSRLGEGSFGIVFRTRHMKSNEVFALKILKLWSVPEHAKPSLIKRFELEFQTGKIDHHNLVMSHHIDYIEGVPYFIMDYCAGASLRQRLRKKLPVEEAIGFAENILEGLDALHSNGKIHRDLKPENILFTEENLLKLSDFGISGHLNIQLTIVNEDNRPEEVFGSYAYMAPEQILPVNRNNTILPTIDIYNFGVLCYEMMTGHYPFGKWEIQSDLARYMSRASEGDWDHPSVYGVDIPDKWLSIIERSLCPDYRRRIQNIKEVKELLHGKVTTQDRCIKSEALSLEVLDGEDHGRCYTLTGKPQKSLLGRLNDDFVNTISITEDWTSFISRRHATIENIDNQWYMRDGQWIEKDNQWQHSKNGTYINGREVSSTGTKLGYSDIITVGNTSIRTILKNN